VLDLEGVAGLEIPFTESLHKYDEGWFFRQLPPGADFIVTTIPGTVARLTADPRFGLASTSPEGRRQAIAFVRAAHQAAERLNNALGRPAVNAIQLHSAPVATPGCSSQAALAESLAEIIAWDWNSVRIVLEHCDALMPGRAPSKGFLSLSDEVDAVQQVNETSKRGVTMAVNWGRSVIEQRRPEAAVEHLGFLRRAGLLGGFTVSGCADVDTRYGAAWADVHVPPAPPANNLGRPEDNGSDPVLEKSSLLTAERLAESFMAAGHPAGTDFRAIKVAAPPNSDVPQRVAAIAKTLDLARSVSVAPAAFSTGG
jgi:hypothetical protein